MRRQYFLGIDLGSSSVKASLVDAETGKCAATTFYPEHEAPIIAVKSGWAEQDTDMWWENTSLLHRQPHHELGHGLLPGSHGSGCRRLRIHRPGLRMVPLLEGVQDGPH